MGKNDKKWQIMTQKWLQIHFKTDEIGRCELFEFKNAQKGTKSKVWPTDQPTKNDKKWQKMIENGTIDDWKCDGWLKQKQKNWKIVKRT